MAKREQKRLVIDTDIAQSASETTNPRSINCRQTLDKILELKFRLVMTPDIFEEWNRHRSRYFGRWLMKIFGSKLQVPLEDADVRNDNLRADISAHAESITDEEGMLKDVHLLEAALATDETILSMNETDRARFTDICEQITLIKDIVWVNPDNPSEECQDWLDNGAPSDVFRMLGYRDNH